MKWINVKERKPEIGQKCIFYSSRSDGEDWGWSIGYYISERKIIDIPPNCGCTGVEYDYTHWMPLPEKPSELD